MDRLFFLGAPPEARVYRAFGRAVTPAALPPPQWGGVRQKRGKHPGATEGGGRQRNPADADAVRPLHERQWSGRRAACRRHYRKLALFRHVPAAHALALGGGGLRGPGRDRSRLHRSDVLVRSNGKQAGGENMNWNLKGGEMNLLPYGYIAWLFCVAGAVIASLPQWFIVQAPHGQGSLITAELIGLPILFIGAILLIISWLPEKRRKYPEILEKTMTPGPAYYLNQPGEGP